MPIKYEMSQTLSTWLVGHFSMVLRGRYELVYLVVPLVILAFIFANHFNIVGSVVFIAMLDVTSLGIMLEDLEHTLG